MNARFLAALLISSLAFATVATTTEPLTLNNETLTANKSPFTDGRLICRELGVAKISIQGKVYLDMPQAYIHCDVMEFVGNSVLSTNGSIEITAERLLHHVAFVSRTSSVIQRTDSGSWERAGEITKVPIVSSRTSSGARAIIQSTKGAAGAGVSGAPQNDVPGVASTGRQGSRGGDGRDARCRVEWVEDRVGPIKIKKPKWIEHDAHHGGTGGQGDRGASGHEGIWGNGGEHGAAGGKITITANIVSGYFFIATRGGDGGAGGVGGIGGKGGTGGTGGMGGQGGDAATCHTAKDGGRGGRGGTGGIGGRGGTGGNGGNGGNGGDVMIRLVEGIIDDVFSIENDGGRGGVGGAGGNGGPGGDGGRGGLGGCGGRDSVFHSGGRCAGEGPAGATGNRGAQGRVGRPGTPGQQGQRGLDDGRIVPLETFREAFDGA